VRYPEEWNYIVKSGWWIEDVDLKKVAKNILSFVSEVDSKFKIYKNRFYSIDIMNTNEWLKVIELNSNPWFPKNHGLYEKVYQYILSGLAY
jgi:glutathione synthase/RimK-type ligase-like ATP-grasp enzyme